MIQFLLPLLAVTTSLDDLLVKAGQTEQARVDKLHCRYTEKAMVEELDKNGRMKGRETHTFAVEHDGMVRTTVRKSEAAEGDKLNAQMRPKETKELNKEELARGRAKLPLHPEEQRNYRFAIDGSEKMGDRTLVALTYEPLKPSPQRLKGTFILDDAPGQLVSMDGTPSEMPTFLNAMTMHIEFSDTPCGVMAKQIELRGEAGFLFIKTRFHTLATWSDQKPK